MTSNKTNVKRSNARQESEVIEIMPCSLIGAAATVRELYIRMGFPVENKTIYIWNDYTGEDDLDIGARPRKKRSVSLKAQAANRARREKYRKSRDRRKSGKTGVAGQEVTKTKVRA